MAFPPLRGPDGLFNVSAAPRFLRDSNVPGWGGAFFTDLLAAEEGRVDHGHERYCVQRALTPFRARAIGTPGWHVVPAGVTLWQPGQDQRFDWQGGGGRQFLFLDIALSEDLLEGARPPRGSPFEPVSTPAVEAMFQALVLDLDEGSPAGPLVGESVVTALFARLAARAVPSPKGALPRAARDRLIGYIDAHLERPVALAELAAVAGVGVRQLCRAFKTSFGESPHQYLLRQRVERAKALLDTDRPLADIALGCGFSDQSQFTRTFSRVAGTGPAAYRSALRMRPCAS